MANSQIHETLDAMLENPKTKNFLGHLVKNYFPTSNVQKVLNRPTGPFKCVLTKENLFSVQDILEGIQTEEYKKDFNEYLTRFLDTNFSGETPMGKLIGDKKMGFTGKETTTYMSFTALQEFYNWVITKSFAGDKHINWLLGGVRDNFYSKPKQVVEKKSNVSTYTLGEVDAFKKLKAKFENES